MSISPEYYPRNFSLSRPSGKNIFEFLIVAEKESTPEITGAFSKFNVALTQAYVNTDSAMNKLVFGVFCDFSRAKVSAEEFSGELKKLQSVIKVESVQTEDSLFDRFFFPLLIMDKYRSIVIRIDPLLKVEKHLSENMGSAGAAIMFDQGRTYAAETVGHYKGALPEAESSVLLRNVVDGLRATGWGLFEFRKDEEGFFVTVKYPPKLENDNMAENRFVMGVAVGILESLYGEELSVVHSRYNKEEDTVSYRLQIKSN